MTADAVATDFSGDDLPLTLIMLIEWVSTCSHDYPWSFGNSADAQHFFMAYNYNGGGTLRPTRKGGGADTQKTAFTSNTITGRAVRSVVFDGTDVWTYLNKTVGINGVDLDTAPATLDMFTIGANRRGGGAGVAQHANIRVPEMMLYKRAISNAEREAIEDYLIAKWGVS